MNKYNLSIVVFIAVIFVLGTIIRQWHQYFAHLKTVEALQYDGQVWHNVRDDYIPAAILERYSHFKIDIFNINNICTKNI